MATKQQYLDAAKKAPQDRTPAEQALVDRGMSMQDVRNEVHATNQRIRTYGR